MRLRLSEVDRKQLGVDIEWLEYDLERVTVREAIMLESIGYDSPPVWRRALGGHDLIIDGQPVLNEEGEPVRRADYAAVAALVWLVLRRHGINLPYEDVDFDMIELKMEVDEPEGKDSATDS